MGSKSLVIDDEYFVAMSKSFGEQGKLLDDMVTDYISLLQTVRSTAITQGNLANALDAFIDNAKKMKDQIGSISGTAQVQITNFLAQVDKADQYLF